VAAAVQAAVMPWTVKAMRVQASTSTAPAAVEDILKFTFESASHPTSVVLGANYVAPANTNAALYDSGDGVWRSFTSRTIPIVAGNKYVSFKGDWRRSDGTYYSMFDGAFTVTDARCRTSGRLAYAPTNNANAYRAIFSGCSRITSFDDNPFQPITGSPGLQMFYYACYSMTSLTNLPTGFMDTSALTGAPAANMFSFTCETMFGVKNLPAGFMNTSGLTGAPASGMFRSACDSMSGVTNLPAGFMDTSGLTGSPAANMFAYACNGMSGVKTLPAGFLKTSGLTGAPAGSMFERACRNMTGVTNLPTGFLDTSGLSGAPAGNMFYLTCLGMSGLIAGNFSMSSNITFSATNIASSMTSAFDGMTKWTGTVYWGTSRIYDAITNPATDANVFQNSTNVPGYTTMGANWK
jgi:hypothetical protein